MRILLPVLLMSSLLTAQAQKDGQNGQKPEQKTEYAQMVERIRAGATDVDYERFRFACGADPSCSFDGDAEKPMLQAYQKKDFARAAELAEKNLETNFTDAHSHFIAWVCWRELGQKEKADFHQDKVKRILASFTLHSDGRSLRAAIPVVDVHEEYEYFQLQGLRPMGQSLLVKDGHQFDRIRVHDPEADVDYDVYFNVDFPMGALARALKGADSDKSNKKKDDKKDAKKDKS